MKANTIKTTYNWRRAIRVPFSWVAVAAALFFCLPAVARSADEDAFTLLNKGSELIEQGKYNEAVDILTLAAKSKFPPEYDVESNYSLIYTNRGLAYYHLGFVDEALADYETALALDPKNPDSLNNRGVIKEKKGDIAGALADYNAAIASNAMLASAYINRASLLIELKRTSEALKDLNNYILLVADNPEVYTLRGKIYLDQGKRELAAADFNRALFLAPGDRDATLGLARLYIASKEYARAEETISGILAVNPDDAEAYLLRSKARDGLGNKAGAQADREKAKSINPNI
jgi:tetratricopeptide (TPR) repeat protein